MLYQTCAAGIIIRKIFYRKDPLFAICTRVRTAPPVTLGDHSLSESQAPKIGKWRVVRHGTGECNELKRNKVQYLYSGGVQHG